MRPGCGCAGTCPPTCPPMPRAAPAPIRSCPVRRHLCRLWPAPAGDRHRSDRHAHGRARRRRDHRHAGTDPGRDRTGRSRRAAGQRRPARAGNDQGQPAGHRRRAGARKRDARAGAILAGLGLRHRPGVDRAGQRRHPGVRIATATTWRLDAYDPASRRATFSARLAYDQDAFRQSQRATIDAMVATLGERAKSLTDAQWARIRDAESSAPCAS